MAVKLTQGSDQSLGMDIMRRINAGELRKASPAHIEGIKAKIVENCEEIVEQGARVRPLMSGDIQVGWCRGVHGSERQLLKHWIKEPNDYIMHVLVLGTSFTKEEIEAMSGTEIRGLTEVVQQMTLYDNALFPYLPAFATTAQSENLWFSKGEALAAWEDRIVTMPDGKQVRIMRPSNHARAWTSLCTYRENAKKRLEADFNALFIVRPWAGRHADPIQAELTRVAKGLETNSFEPWEQIVRPVYTVDKTDGWGHPGDSVEDLQRELKGMMEGDKHERLMEAWASQMGAEAAAAQKKLEEERKRRGTDKVGIISERMEILTDKQVRERQAELKAGRVPKQSGAVRRDNHETDPSNRQIEKIRKYS